MDAPVTSGDYPRETLPRCLSLSPFDVNMVKGPPHLVSHMKVRCCLYRGHCGAHKGLDGSEWED